MNKCDINLNARKWEALKQMAYFIKPEYIDKEKLLKSLENYYDYDVYLLDILLMNDIINADEYEKYLEKLIDIAYAKEHEIKERIKDCHNCSFNIIKYYGLGIGV